LQNLAQWCCVNPGVQEPEECPLRRKIIRLEVVFRSLNVLLGNPKCFSGDDYVSMANGEMKLLRDLQVGDRVLSMNAERKVVEDEVILMLDSQPKRPGQTLRSFHVNNPSFFV
jgi:hypothetical protein